MSVVPAKAGKAHVNGVTIDYATDRSHLWRRGDQTFDTNVRIRAR